MLVYLVPTASDMSSVKKQLQKLQDKARGPAYPLYKATQSKALGYFQIFLCGLCSLVTGAVQSYEVGMYASPVERDIGLGQKCLKADARGISLGVVFAPVVSIIFKTLYRRTRIQTGSRIVTCNVCC